MIYMCSGCKHDGNCTNGCQDTYKNLTTAVREAVVNNSECYFDINLRCEDYAPKYRKPLVQDNTVIIDYRK